MAAAGIYLGALALTWQRGGRRSAGRLAGGAALLLLAGWLLLAGLIMLLAALFFYLGDLPLARAAVITGIIGLLAATLSAAEGWRLITRPER